MSCASYFVIPGGLCLFVDPPGTSRSQYRSQNITTTLTRNAEPQSQLQSQSSQLTECYRHRTPVKPSSTLRPVLVLMSVPSDNRTRISVIVCEWRSNTLGRRPSRDSCAQLLLFLHCVRVSWSHSAALPRRRF